MRVYLCSSMVQLLFLASSCGARRDPPRRPAKGAFPRSCIQERDLVECGSPSKMGLKVGQEGGPCAVEGLPRCQLKQIPAQESKCWTLGPTGGGGVLGAKPPFWPILPHFKAHCWISSRPHFRPSQVYRKNSLPFFFKAHSPREMNFLVHKNYSKYNVAPHAVTQTKHLASTK